MTTQEKPQRRFDLRALPIAFKIAAGVVILSVIGGLVTDQLIHQIVNDVQTDVSTLELERANQEQAVQIVGELEEAAATLTRLGRLAAIQGQLKLVALDQTSEDEGTIYLPINLIDQYVVAFSQAGPGFEAVAVLDTRGRILAIDPVPDDTVLQAMTESSVEDWVWFNTAYNWGDGRTFFSGPMDDGLTGRRGVHIAVPIYDTQTPDQVLGIVYGVWNMEIIAEAGLPGEAFESIILQPDGTVLVSSSITQEDISPGLLVALNQSPSKGFTFEDNTGRAWLYGYVSLNEMGITDEAISNLRWIVATRQTMSSAQAGGALLLNRLRLVLGASILLTTLVIFLFTRGTLRPLLRLTEAASRIEAGELGTPIPQLPADEIGHLANSLRGLVNQLLYRVRRLQAAVQVSQAAVLTRDVDEMLNDVAGALLDRFGYPDVRIYLTDPAGTRAWLRAASGPEGERLLAQQERLPVDDSSLVGRAILLGEPQLGAGRASFHSAGFTTAQSELSLPMHTGEEILGALYVQAGRLGAFAPEDINLLRLLADQIGASVQNARLLDQTATSLAEIEMLNRRLTRQGWDEYLDGTRMLRHTPDPAQQWPDSLATARKQQEITADVYADDDGRSVLAVPLILRGEAIGSIGVTRPAGYHWTADEMALLEAIAARMTIIAEGIRLVDEAAMAAQREQTINEVSAHMLQRAASVDTILQRALNQLGDALGSDHVSLRIGAPPVESERQLTSVSGQGAGPHVPANGDEADAGDIGGPDELPAPPDDNGDGGMSDVA